MSLTVPAQGEDAASAGNGTTSRLPVNWLALVLVAGMGLAIVATGFVSVAPNRILTGRPVAAVDALLLPAFVMLLALMAGIGLSAVGRPSRMRHGVAALCAAALLVATMVFAGLAASDVAATSGPAARTSLGAAFWLLAAGSALSFGDSLQRLALPRFWGRILGLAPFVAVIAVAAGGALKDLSLAKEFAARSSSFIPALTTHIGLVLGALAIALPIGAGLGLLALARPVRAPGLFAGLNLLQTVPSIALFALLIGPLTSLTTALPALRDIGIAGIGAAPAVIALALYALLPTARSIVTGFSGVPADAVEAARGMGMTSGQILLRVSLPLALPVLLAGLRIVVVQTIGLAVVAALIGAGGLGSFVFLGLGQTATDLVLLGALSAIALALVADAALRLLADLTSPQVPT